MAVSEASVNFGTEKEFLSADGTIYNSLGMLNDSKFVVGYQDNSDSKHSKVKIGTVSGDDVVFGAESEFFSLNNFDVYSCIAVLDESTFVVEYQDESDSGHGTVKVGTVSGTSVTFGSEVEYLSAGRATWTSIATLDATHFVVVYSDWNDDKKGKAIIGTVSGSSVTFGSATVFYSSNEATIMDVSALSSSGFVVGYRKGNAVDLQGAARIGTVSGTSITFGTEAEFTTLSSSSSYSISVDTFSSSKFVVAYRDASDSDHGTAKIGTVSGTSITFGAESEFLSADGTLGHIVKILDSSNFIIVYKDGSDSNHGTAKIGTVAGTNVTFNDESEFLSANDTVPSGVNIEIWDVVDGQNTKLAISNSGCYSIDDTFRWGWSTEYLPFRQEYKRYHYYFRMTSDEGEQQYGEFFITVPERGRWSYPD
jgi:hypothetical protein